MEENGIILVIESDTQNRAFLIDQVLHPLSYRIACASTGKIGLEQALLVSPILIIIGESLPDFSSLEFLSIFQQSSCASPILLLTENPSQTHLIEAFKQGICDYLLLPTKIDVARETLQRVLKNALEKSRREKLNKKLLMVEAIQITLTTLSHYLNNYLTALGGDLTLLQESLQSDAERSSMVEIVKNGQNNLECIQLVTQVLFNTTSVSFTQYDDSIPMIDIQNAIMQEFTRMENKKLVEKEV
jgi:DNA-binding response OmpR family regulator